MADVMSALVTATLRFRRAARASAGFVLVAGFAALVAIGVFREPFSAFGEEHAVVGTLAFACLVGRFVQRMQTLEGDPRLTRLEIELGLWAVVSTHAVLGPFGGLNSSLHPLTYAVVALFAAFASRRAAVVVIPAAAAFEALVFTFGESRPIGWELAHRVAFVLGFGMLNAALARAEIARIRDVHRRELESEREKVARDSRMFRLASPASRSEGDDDRLFQSSVDEVHHALFHLLRMLHQALDLHTVALLMLDDTKKTLSISELVTDSDNLIATGTIGAGEGAVAAVAIRGQTMNLENLRAGYKGLSYYSEPTGVSAFLGIPVVDGGKVIGALCCDRLEKRPFTTKEESIVAEAAVRVLRALENERVFVQLERSKREQTVLYKTSTALGAALDEAAVVDAGLLAAREIALFDFAAITLYDPELKKHSVRRAVGEGAEAFAGLTFQDNTSLTAMAIKNRHYLPYRGDYDPRTQTVFTRRVRLRGMESVLVLPLIVREDAIGTLVLGGARKDAFGHGIRLTLEVLANQLAVAMSNAAAVSRLEELATTDGLTGCLNKRTFLEKLDEKLRSAQRFGKPLSLIVTDIDHFKSVNDTYGHATGDVVIKELGRILRMCKRETDVVARFGGEEFCILLEETETDGAILFAERVREELGSTVFQTELGKLSVKASLGVATFPQHAGTAAQLFDVTDKALYVAKQSGRNQVCTPARAAA